MWRSGFRNGRKGGNELPHSKESSWAVATIQLHESRFSGAAFCVAWLCIFYGTNGYFFGVANNVEELPAIYYLADAAEYPDDPMVEGLVTHWNQATPYLYVLGPLVRLVGFDKAPTLFLGLNVFLLAVSYFALRGIVRSLCNCTDLAVFFILSSLLAVDNCGLIPNQRTLFFNFVDPEHVSIVFCLATLAAYVQNRIAFTVGYLFMAAIIHPLYALPVVGCLWFVSMLRWWRGETSATRAFATASVFGLVSLPYALLLWAMEREATATGWDISLVQEIIRSPRCHVISHLGSVEFWSAWWFPTTLGLFGLAIFGRGPSTRFASANISRKFDSRALFEIVIVALLLGSYILLASGISGIARVPLLVKLTPFRMGAILVPLLWLIVISVFLRYHRLPVWTKSVAVRGMAICGIIVISAVYAAGAGRISLTLDAANGQWISPEGSEIFQFVRTETDPYAMFLNYTDLDLRTACLRSEVFRFKTIPLVAKPQRQWYRRMLAINNVPANMVSEDYVAVRNFIQRERSINLRDVLRRLDCSVGYVLVNHQPAFLDVYSSCNGKGNICHFDTEGLAVVLENSHYTIFKVPVAMGNQQISSTTVVSREKRKS